jgi:hypothetical protein
MCVSGERLESFTTLITGINTKIIPKKCPLVLVKTG